MELGPHAGYIIAGYLVSFFVIAGLVVWYLAANRRVQARIEELEARGIRRRSDKAGDRTVADQGSKA
jgi:heme exporter protein D